MPATSKPRVVIAGQKPPPYGGQNIMIARQLQAFEADGRFTVEHLPFHFTPDFKEVRQGNLRKVFELVRVVGRLLALRLRGPIDLIIFPSGGPQTVPIIRDLLLLPWLLLTVRRVVLQFHAAGIADRCAQGGLLCRALRFLYPRCFAAIVMTPFNRRDPAAFGIQRIEVIPHTVPDEFDSALVRRESGKIRLLYVGHLCPEKGTPELLESFAAVAKKEPDILLELVGECLPPLSTDSLREQIRELGVEDRVILSGLLTGRAKQEAFGRADLFVFPSIAPYESFGLVMVEAMMWGLPVVATDWRGNRDVLGHDFEGICQPIDGNLLAALETALTSATQALRAKAWSGQNRSRYLIQFRFDQKAVRDPDVVERWLAL